MNKKLLISGVFASSLSLLCACDDGGKHDHALKEQHHEQTNADSHQEVAMEQHHEHADGDAHHEGEMEHHGPHEHGAAKLSFATTETGFDVMLDTPAVNVFGFEHAASTDEQKQQIEASASILRTGASFVANTEAACSLKTVELDSPMLTDKTDVQGHVDLDGSWSFNCDQADKLAEVKVGLFGQFPERFKRLDVEWVTEGGASAKTITEDDVIELK